MATEESEARVLDTRGVEAFIFDMDGVVTDTSQLHARTWKEVFDQFLMDWSQSHEVAFRSFDIQDDYNEYVDGKPRYDGAKSFLDSRGISLPYGDPSDPPDRNTVCGVANRKDKLFQEALERGIEPYETTVRFISQLEEQGIRSAVISSSRNAEAVLSAAGVADLFEVRVDGVTSAELGIPGKPHPAIFLEAARRLGVETESAVVVEDALSGVQAGSRGGFAAVVGVDRAGQAEALRREGADIVVSDLAEISLAGPGAETSPGGRPVEELPSALADDGLWQRIQQTSPAVFLDYDGTLTPIVDDPDEAVLPEQTRRVLEHLAEKCLVAIVSGRDLADVKDKVGVGGLVYAGSHGLEVDEPGSARLGASVGERFEEYLRPLEEATRELNRECQSLAGVSVERKQYAIAVHYRAAGPEAMESVEEVVDRIAEREPRLRKTEGKMVFELRPAAAWDKGRALDWLLEALGHDRAASLPIYIGDDITDEDAFREIQEDGFGILVVDAERRAARPDTAARFLLEDPSEVRQFLARLADLL